MGDLTYLIIILVVINLVGRLMRALQKSAPQQKPGDQPGKPPALEPKSPFAVLEEKLQKLEELDKKMTPSEEPPSHLYAFETADQGIPEFESVETDSSFARESAKTREAAFEEKHRENVPDERFPYGMQKREYIAPERPVTPAPEPVVERSVTYRRDIVEMLRDTDGLRSAIVISTILGPPRSKRSFRASWGAER